ncbi:flagellar biosynthesis protein FlhA [Mariniblastus sp.]|nr:flagellar biosynthesis protein FlhA [Mariniblastus sp.]
MNFAKSWPDYLLPIGIIACLMVIFVPLPPMVMDIMLAANISVAVIILLATVYAKSPLELSVFPSLLLVTTLARLALNVGTTRLILTRGAIDGDQAAGGVIQGFSQFVAGDSLAVGFVIFAIILVIQFVVITKGASRISEVAARFTLDGMPGRQLAIDADLNAGVIDNEEAQQQRKDVIAQADFYGTMDGASKFVRGDAIAGAIITLINIAAGLVIGLSAGMTLAEAGTTFTRLTIGDGLVSQLPALLISLAAGLLVTRSTRQTDLSRESVKQVFAHPVVLVITAIFLALMVATNLPKIPLLALAAACLGGAYALQQRQQQTLANNLAVANATQVNQQTTPAASDAHSIEKLLASDVVEMQLGMGLIRLADPRSGGVLLEQITTTRKLVANQIGIVLPKVRLKDDMHLDANQFKILIQGRVVEQGTVQPDFCLAIDTGNANKPLGELAVREVADGHLADGPSYWILPESIAVAQQAGYQVKTSTDVLSQQLEFAAIENADDLLTRDATKLLIDSLRVASPTVVDEVIPNVLTISQVQQVLKMLVKEGISIRPLGLILETLGDHASETQSIWQLTEYVRQRLSHHIAAGLAGAQRAPVSIFTLSSELQHRLACAWDNEQQEIRIGLSMTVRQSLSDAINAMAEQMIVTGFRPIMMVEQSIRPAVASLCENNQTSVFVLGSKEAESAELNFVGEIGSADIQTLASAA